MVKPKFTIIQSNTLECIKLEQNCFYKNTGRTIMEFSTNTKNVPGLILPDIILHKTKSVEMRTQNSYVL